MSEAKTWLTGFIGKSYVNRLQLWDKGLIATAASTIDNGNCAPMPQDPELSDLRVAFGSRVLFLSKVDEKDDALALKAILSRREEISYPRAAVQLRVLDWIVQQACTMDFSRPTAEQVASLLRRVPASMKRWCWEKVQPRKGERITWQINNEYHVQDLLWIVLAPLFADLEDEENLPSVGHKHPRCDIGIPSLHLIVEAKFIRDGGQAEFAKMAEQIAADVTCGKR